MITSIVVYSLRGFRINVNLAFLLCIIPCTLYTTRNYPAKSTDFRYNKGKKALTNGPEEFACCHSCCWPLCSWPIKNAMHLCQLTNQPTPW